MNHCFSIILKGFALADGNPHRYSSREQLYAIRYILYWFSQVFDGFLSSGVLKKAKWFTWQLLRGITALS
jgi:hypothetical protein